MKKTAQEIEHLANLSLREAVSCERAKRWNKVIYSYSRLLRLLDKDSLPTDCELPPGISTLLYESHYHLGLALQQIGEHEKAVGHYTKAIEAVSVPKNGCCAGCNSNSCLMTPVYARRAFTYCKTGAFNRALKDADKAVMLDSKNSDVLCIRALTRSTREEYKEAMKDLATALRYNSRHLCSLIVRGAMESQNKIGGNDWFDYDRNTKTETNKDTQKAISINPDCQMFLGVNSFKHKDIITFYERFLYSLSVPHTVSSIHLVYKRKPDSRPDTGTDHEVHDHGDHRSVSRLTASPNQLQQNHTQTKTLQSFRCGTPMPTSTKSANKDVLIPTYRRHQYGEAIRRHTKRPLTADEFIASLQKDRHKPPSRPHTIGCETRLLQHERKNRFSGIRANVTQGHDADMTLAVQPPKGPMNTPSYLKVFQHMNIKDAPRMYYKPWLGDKLPVAEISKKDWITPPFK